MISLSQSSPATCFRFTHPRLSSDTSLSLCDEQNSPVLLGVADMIGRPIGLPWRNYMRTAERLMSRHYRRKTPRNLDDLTGFLRGELIEHNRMIREIATRHDRTAFGFCVVFLLRQERQCRVVWLGDSRAYCIRRDPSSPRRFSCASLTHDHNQLDAEVRAKGDFVLFRSELHELGKQLGVFLGDEPDRVKSTLETDWTDVVLDRDEMLLLATDGLYMPLIRMALDRASDQITLDRLYLGTFLSNWFSEQPEVDAPCPPWKLWTRRLLDDVTRYTRQHRSYRDDIAVCGMHLA